MTTKQKVLELLQSAGDQSVSGEAMAAELSVQRNTVWKAVCGLKKDGYRIDSVPNRGYRYCANNDVLSTDGIRRYLAGEALPYQIVTRQSVTSTNTELKAAAENGAPAFSVLAAEEQTNGRGRRGRQFYSPGKHGLYMSVLLRPAFAAGDALSITTAAAVAVCRAIERESGKKPSIKWVNDVYLDGRKASGILTEASVDLESGGLHYAILGIGINLSEPEGGFPKEIAEIATTVYGKEAPPDAKNRMAAAILSAFYALYHALPDKTHMAAYRAYSFVLGKPVNVLSAAGERPAVAEEIDDMAHLIVRYPDGSTEALSSGEISIRPTK